MADVINVTRSSLPDFEEYCEEIRSIWDSCWLTNMGVKHRQLEAQLKDYLKTPNLSLLTNGHLALETAIQALGLKGEIVTSPFTFASTTHAIVRSGCTPVFCDIDPANYTIDAARIERLITENTVAILPIHVYGNLCDTEAIAAIADKYKLKVIYDAAHAFGVKKSGISAANFGDVSMFSFQATKVFHTIEGGALCYRDAAIGSRIDDIKNFGIHGPEHVTGIGGNAKLNEFCAAMGICNLRHLDGWIARRKELTEHYDARLGGVPGIKLRQKQADVEHNYIYYPVVFDGYKRSRDEIFDHLAANGIIPRKYFYPITNDFEAYRGRPGFDPADTPIAKYIGDRVMTLPLFTELADDDIDRICDLILA